eukprot:403353029
METSINKKPKLELDSNLLDQNYATKTTNCQTPLPLISPTTQFMLDREFFYTEDDRNSQHLDLSKPYKPLLQLAVDLLMFLIYGVMLFVAYLLYLQEMLTPYFTDSIVTAENCLITLMFLMKFLLCLAIYKNTEKGNSKENTLLIFTIRMFFDFLVIAPALLYLLIYMNEEFGKWHLMVYAIPLFLCEVILYYCSVRGAIKRCNEKEARRQRLEEHLLV